MCRNHQRNSPPIPAGPHEELKTHTKTFTNQTHTHTQQAWTHSTTQAHTNTHTGLHTPFIMSDDGESSTPPPCELWMVLHEECEENEMRRVKHKHDEFFQKVYGLYTQELQSPKYTVDSMGENGWEKWCDYLLKPPPPSSVQARLNGPGGRWGAGEAGRRRWWMAMRTLKC